MRVPAAALALLLVTALAARAQAPNTVYMEDLTTEEIRALIAGGARNVIVATGGTEDNGPQMVLGKHNYIVRWTSGQIARALGNTLVAPVIAYVPEGGFTPPTGHMQRAGSISLPDSAGYTDLLKAAANSMKGAGFRNIIFIGDSGGNQAGMKAVAEELNGAWKGSGVRIIFAPDYYAKAHADQQKYIVDNLHIPADKIGGHANVMDTSELMFVDPTKVRLDRLEVGNATNGISGDATIATPQLGQAFLKIKIDDALAQIRQLMATGGNAR